MEVIDIEKKWFINAANIIVDHLTAQKKEALTCLPLEDYYDDLFSFVLESSLIQFYPFDKKLKQDEKDVIAYDIVDEVMKLLIEEYDGSDYTYELLKDKEYIYYKNEYYLLYHTYPLDIIEKHRPNSSKIFINNPEDLKIFIQNDSNMIKHSIDEVIREIKETLIQIS